MWRSKNALAPNPSWKLISDGIPTNAIGSITVDPNDPTGKTIYVGTGEANASGDSEAGVGLYRTTDGGAHWSPVPGAAAISNLRAIGGTAIEPGDPSHIAIATRAGMRGDRLEQHQHRRPSRRSRPRLGIWETHDGGANWTLTRAGVGVRGPLRPGQPERAVRGDRLPVGLTALDERRRRRETIFSSTASGRFTFSPVVKNGKTRIYLADANGGAAPPTGAQVYRVDDASQPAATLTASNNAAWTRLSNPTDGNARATRSTTTATRRSSARSASTTCTSPSPADNPDEVVVSGLMHYEELKPYAAPGRPALERPVGADVDRRGRDVEGHDGRRRRASRCTRTSTRSSFVPGNPNQFFAGSDGGVIRTNGKFVDGSSMCNGRGLSAAFLADCQSWLSRSRRSWSR